MNRLIEMFTFIRKTAELNIPLYINKSMKAGEERFMDIVRKDVQFKIPIYQRSYDWRTEHCQTLFDDILQLLRNPEIPIHFMGSIVYIDEKGQYLVGSTRELLLIDGQQRITTFTLIFLILEELAKSQDNEGFALKIRNTCLVNLYSKLENKNKLILTKQDNEILELFLRGETVEGTESNLLTNYNYLKNRFEGIIDEFSLEEIYDNLDRIMVVNVGLLQGQDNPQQIFESLNATGKALTDADLIRNFLLMNLDTEQQNKIYLSYWYPMENLLGNELELFLEFFTYMERGISTNIKDLYKEFKIFLYKQFNKENGIEKLADKLLKYAKYYDAIIFANDSNEKINAVLRDLNSLGYYSHIPLLLKIYNEYKSGAMDSGEFMDILLIIESFLFRRSICNIPTNSLNPIFRTMWKKIINPENLHDFMEDKSTNLKFNLIKELKSGDRNKRWPDDDEFREKLIYNDLYHHRFDKQLLEELERVSSKDSRSRSFDDFSVEHILPQTAGDPEKLSDEWKEMLGPEYAEIRTKWLHKLGNLSLTAYNPELSNKNFEEKKNMKDGFKESPLKLNLEIAVYDLWNEKSIIDRSNTLAARAIKRWEYDNDY